MAAMTTVVLKPDPQQLPAGTTVGAFPRSRWGIALEGTPSGSAAESHAVASDGTLTYTTLTDGTEYVATAVVSSTRRFVRFQSGPSKQSWTSSAGYANGEVPVWNSTTGRFEPGSAGASTTVATDAIWDTKGDLAVGTGANTASKLAAGSNGQVLTAQSGQATGLLWADVDVTQAELDAVSALITIVAANTQTTSYTLVLGDAGKSVEENSSSATVVTIPPNSSVAFPTGTVIEVCRIGSGSVTITPGAGVTIPNRLEAAGTTSRTITSQWSSASIRKRATDVWVLVGDIA